MSTHVLGAGRQLSIDIVTGLVAHYAKQVAELQGLTNKELASILNYIAGQLS